VGEDALDDVGVLVDADLIRHRKQRVGGAAHIFPGT
jgi:hypothetical protein